MEIKLNIKHVYDYEMVISQRGSSGESNNS